MTSSEIVISNDQTKNSFDAFNSTLPIFNNFVEQPQNYDSKAPYKNYKLNENEKLNDISNIPELKEEIKKFEEPELNNINIEEENQKDFIYTELFSALFNRYYNNVIKLIDMGVKVDYPENNFDETPLGLLLRYYDESSEEEKEKINIILEKLIDKNVKFDYEKDSYNNYRVFTYLAHLISNKK